MKTNVSLNPQIAFWGICLFALGWITATVLFEIHLGWPGSGIQWCKRLLGWAVEFWLVRSLSRGVRRYYRSSARM